MRNPHARSVAAVCFGWKVILVAALAYGLWLGAHWLPLDYSDKELAALASRAWDLKHELAAHRLPWWTPWYMSGSSYALLHTHSFCFVPWLILSTFASLLVAGKLLALGAIAASALTMYLCARYFMNRTGNEPLVSEWAAVLAGVAFMLHPQQVTRAAATEHLTISLSLSLVPLLWWRFARALETETLRDAGWCALVFALAFWTDNKQLVVQGVFLGCYAVYQVACVGAVSNRDSSGHSPPVADGIRSHGLRTTRGVRVLRTCLITGGLTVLLAAFAIVPALTESKYVKLFEADPVAAWQRSYSFKGLLGLVDRDAWSTKAAMKGVTQALQAQRYRPTSAAEADAIRAKLQRVFSLPMDAPEKYAGIVLLLLAGAAVLFNRRRADAAGRLGFFVGMFALAVWLAFGPTTVWNANWQTGHALFSLDGVPGTARLAVLVGSGTLIVFLALLSRRQLTTPRRRWLAAAAVLGFLFLPGFKGLAALPYFSDIRAPFVFYDVPAAFFLALLAAFFVTEVIGPRVHTGSSPDGTKTGSVLPVWVVSLSLLLLVDYWPYQQPMKDTSVRPGTVGNLRAAYSALASDPDWVKTYSISGRYFHLLGPMWSGKPQVYEAFLNWMCPQGTALLNQQGAGSLPLLDLFAARYLVFDKTDPANASPPMQQWLQNCRQALPVTIENEDVAVFRNDRAHPYVTACAHPCLFVGDLRQSALLALSLSERGYFLVHAEQPELLRVPVEELTQYDQVYVVGGDIIDLGKLPTGLRSKVRFINPGGAPFLPTALDARITFTNVQLSREGNGVVRCALTTPSACLAVFAESYYPFWTARVDGQPAPVRRVSTGLIGVRLPGGTHTVLLRYCAPRAYAVSALVSGLVFLAVIGWLLVPRSRAKP